MKIKSNKHRIINISVLYFSCGVLSLFLSYLCFINIIQISIFESPCSYPCEYWWSWLWDFPPLPPCQIECQPRNILYKPLFVIGPCFIIISIIYCICKCLGELYNNANQPDACNAGYLLSFLIFADVLHKEQ